MSIRVALIKALPARISALLDRISLGLTFDQADELRRALTLAMEAVRLRQLARTYGLPCAICKHHHPAGAAHMEALP